MSDFLVSLLSLSIISCALISGVFLSFSDFVMRSLYKTRAPGGAEAMQHINREVFRTLFMVLLIGMSVLSPILIWLAITQASGTARIYVLAGGAIYMSLVFAVTMLGNVPMNRRLDQLQPDIKEADNYWHVFYPKWTRFNHIRTFGACLSSICFLLACLTIASVQSI